MPNKYVVSFTKSSSNPSYSNATNGINNPIRSGYTFGGWYTALDYSDTQYMDMTTAPNGVLYAKWNKNSCVAEGTLITLADDIPAEAPVDNAHHCHRRHGFFLGDTPFMVLADIDKKS